MVPGVKLYLQRCIKYLRERIESPITHGRLYFSLNIENSLAHILQTLSDKSNPRCHCFQSHTAPIDLQVAWRID